MTSETIKGFNDYIGEEAVKRAEIKKILVNVFEKYGFGPTETPMIEYENFVKGDNSNDEAVSDIFKLKDKGKRALALRYELTFQLKRLMRNQKLPFKRYQIGEVFRDEPVSSNRFRQFTQCDVDVVGSTIKDEAEILALVKKVLDKLGVKFTVYVGNRKMLDELLNKENIKNKEQVLREIDKINKLGEKEVRKNLKKLKAEKALDSLKKIKNYKDVEELKKYCKYYGIDIKFQPFLVRGLGYYNGNVFEVKTSAMKETIVAGGSFMFNNIQSTGISFGLDRFSKLVKLKDEKDKFLIVSLDKDKEAIKIAEKLRVKGENCRIYYGKPSKALEYANSKKINKVIFIGEKEVKAKKFKIKDMVSGRMKELRI